MINLKEFTPHVNDRKHILSFKLSEHKELLYRALQVDGVVYDVPSEVYEEIIKNSGLAKNLSKVLSSKYYKTFESLLLDLYEHYYEGLVNLLVVDNVVTSVYTSKFTPILNHEFINIMMKILEDYSSEVFVDSYYYDVDSRVASVTIYPCQSKGEYLVGVVVTNDETGSVNCRKIVKKDNLVFYLPSKYYKVSSKRYNKSAANSKDSLNLMMLKVIEDMTSNYWYSICDEIQMNMKICEKIPTTYEEYRYAERLVRREIISSDMTSEESSDIIDNLFSEFEDFESNYPDLDESKKSYIWRCSALSDKKISSLIESLNSFSNNYGIYPESRVNVQTAIGEFIMLDKISTTLAKRRRGEEDCLKG